MKKIITIILLTAVSIVSATAQCDGLELTTANPATDVPGDRIHAINSTYAASFFHDVSSGLDYLAIVPIGASVPITPLTWPKTPMPDKYFINDVYVHDNYIYVCGTHKITATLYEGWIGRATLNASGNNFTGFVYYDINTVFSVDRLVAYTNGATNKHNVVAIGHCPVLGSYWGTDYVLHLDYNVPTLMPPNYEYVKYTDYDLQDITVTDHYVAVVGEDMSLMADYAIMKIEKNSATFSVNEYQIQTPDFLYGHPIRCTATKNDEIAVAHTTDYYTIPPKYAVAVKIIDMASEINTKSFYYPVYDKIATPELTYIPDNERLVILHQNTVFPSVTSGSNFLYFDPYSTLSNPYMWIYDSDEKQYSDVATLGTKHFIAAGFQWITCNATLTGFYQCYIKDTYDVYDGIIAQIRQIPQPPIYNDSIAYIVHFAFPTNTYTINTICNF